MQWLTWSLAWGLLGQPAPVMVSQASGLEVTMGGVAAAMPRRPVQSGNITSIGYDPKTKTLEVEFKNGVVYQYYGVPAALHQGLMRATSHGRYLDRYVKKGGYQYREL